MPDFVNTYECDTTLPYYGFQSWNHFFARKLKSDKVRPVASPDDPLVISAPCEAVPHFRGTKSKAPRSVLDQGTAVQLATSAQRRSNDGEVRRRHHLPRLSRYCQLPSLAYPQWDGNNKPRAYIKEGAYYAAALSFGYDPTGGIHSQRLHEPRPIPEAIVFIDTGNPKIGTVAFIAIGMSEISSCPLEVYVGQKVKKGDPLGNFQFGGSTYCLLFEKGVSVTFTAERYPLDQWPDTLQKVNSELGTIHLDSGR